MSRLFIGCLFLAACGSSSTTGDDDTDGVATGDLLGTFQIELVEPANDTAGFTAVLGKVFDGTQPETVIWTDAMSAGGCTLKTPSVPFCSTPCGSAAACVADDTCQAYPASQAVGTVTIDGVADSAVTLTSVQNSYQLPAGTTLAYPAFAEGDTLRLHASGSEFTSGFTSTAFAIAPLALTSPSFALVEGQPLLLAWTPSGAAAIAVKLDISHHGGSKGKVECTLDDSGASEIASPIVDQLLALGAAGFPTIIVTRVSTGHAQVADGHIDLLVTSELEQPIDVPGVISCTDDGDCEAPTTCQDDLTCR